MFAEYTLYFTEGIFVTYFITDGRFIKGYYYVAVKSKT